MTQPDRKVRWEEMFPDELLGAIRAHPVVWMPYGLAEPHGAYNALGLDWLKAQAICERAAREHGGVLAPPMCWHVLEIPAFDFCGRLGVKQSLGSGIPADLFLRMVLHQIRAFDARGFRVAMLVTGHYGGPERDMRLLGEWYSRRTGSPMRIHCVADCECIGFEDYRGDHAGPCETQQLLAARPDLVDLTRREPSPESGPWCGQDLTASAGPLSREVGQRIIGSQVAALGRVQKELLDGCPPAGGWTPPNQDVVEELWRGFERLTRKYWVMSTTWEEYCRVGPPPFPGWEALGV